MKQKAQTKGGKQRKYRSKNEKIYDNCGGGGRVKLIPEIKKPKSTVDTNKTNKAQAIRFCSTASHHPSVNKGNFNEEHRLKGVWG